jgi:hypothetical protein
MWAVTGWVLAAFLAACWVVTLGVLRDSTREILWWENRVKYWQHLYFEAEEQVRSLITKPKN